MCRASDSPCTTLHGACWVFNASARHQRMMTLSRQHAHDVEGWCRVSMAVSPWRHVSLAMTSRQRGRNIKGWCYVSMAMTSKVGVASSWSWQRNMVSRHSWSWRRKMVSRQLVMTSKDVIGCVSMIMTLEDGVPPASFIESLKYIIYFIRFSIVYLPIVEFQFDWIRENLRTT